MTCKNATIVFDPLGLFPSYGENDLSTSFDGTKLVAMISYDDKKSNVLKKVILTFENTFFHRVTSIPGIDESSIKYEANTNLGSLIEYGYSEFRDQWENHFNQLFKLKHFRIFLLNANKSLEVICENVIIS